MGTYPLTADDTECLVLIHCQLMTHNLWVLIHCQLMTQSESLGIHCQLMTQNVLVLIHCQLHTRLLGYNAWVHVHCQLMTQVFGYSVDGIIIMSGYSSVIVSWWHILFEYSSGTDLLAADGTQSAGTHPLAVLASRNKFYRPQPTSCTRSDSKEFIVPSGSLALDAYVRPVWLTDFVSETEAQNVDESVMLDTTWRSWRVGDEG